MQGFKIKECVGHTHSMGDWDEDYLRCRYCGKAIGWLCGTCEGMGHLDTNGEPCTADDENRDRDCPECEGSGEVMDI